MVAHADRGLLIGLIHRGAWRVIQIDVRNPSPAIGDGAVEEENILVLPVAGVFARHDSPRRQVIGTSSNAVSTLAPHTGLASRWHRQPLPDHPFSRSRTGESHPSRSRAEAKHQACTAPVSSARYPQHALGEVPKRLLGRSGARGIKRPADCDATPGREFRGTSRVRYASTASRD
jgi:hypothetical protein